MYSNIGLQEVPTFEGLDISLGDSMSQDFMLPEFNDYSLFEDCLDKKVPGLSNEIVKVEEEDQYVGQREQQPNFGSSCRYATPVPQQQQQTLNQHQINQQQSMGQQHRQPQQQQMSNMPSLCQPTPQATTPTGYPYAPSPAYPGHQAPVSSLGSPSNPRYEHISYQSNSPANYSPASPYSSAGGSLGSPVTAQPSEDFMPLRQALFNQHAQSMGMSAAGYGLQFGSFYEHQMMDGKRRKHDFELTPEEYEKRRLRRERNKMAALRCRQRRRERIEELEQETAKIEGENSKQQSEIQRLQQQVKELQKMLKEHQCLKPIDSNASPPQESTSPLDSATAPSFARLNISTTSAASRSVRTLSSFADVKNEN